MDGKMTWDLACHEMDKDSCHPDFVVKQLQKVV
jgi:hypothetical protein